MNNRIFFLVVFVWSTLSLLGQSLKPCGTPAYKAPWLKAYQQRPPTAQVRGNQDSILYLPMTVHSVGEDDGDGHFGTLNILDAFCTLNEDFKASNIQFYLAADIQLINNTAIYEHDSVYVAGLFMLENDVPNTLNTYLLKDPAGNCGYNLPWASMTVAKMCAGKQNHTWAHEVGHHFTIQHPFLGWEGGISYDGSIEPDYNQPAPEFVVYNYTIFKEQPYIDTLIIDTALVEKMDGSNCHIAADGFCDTAPDYLTGRWECRGNENESRTVQTDPNGVQFRSDASLIMGNSQDECKTRFTPQQIAAMRAYVLEERQDLFVNPLPLESPIVESPNLLYPIGEEAVPVDAVELTWEAVPNATRYIVQISRLRSFPEGLTDTYETEDLTLLVDDLVTERDYFWRVRPYNFYHTCTNFSEEAAFEVVESVTSISKIIGLENIQVQPTIQQIPAPIQVMLQTSLPLTGTLELVNVAGAILYSKPMTIEIGETHIHLPTNRLVDGLYFVGIRTEEGRIFRKVILR